MRTVHLVKKSIRTFLSVCILISCFFATAQNTNQKLTQAPFHQGVNMTTWFELWSKGVGNLNYYDKSDLENLKSLGADVIRLPVHFDNLSSGAPDYVINPLTWKYLDQVVSWCEELQIYIIIDDHSFNGIDKYPDEKTIANHLQKVWPQIAQRYKDRSNYVIYEILNEPTDIDVSTWNRIQGNALETIRKFDKTHTVVVTGTDWGGAGSLRKVKVYNDNNLIYSFHFYSPFVFTHQGASWTSKEETALSAIPFPYDKTRMPQLPKELKGTWMDDELKSNYKNNGTVEALRKEMEIAYNFSKKNNVPVWCGEMGAYNLNSLPEDRVRWYETVGSLLHEYNIPFTVWGFGGGFGLYRKNTSEQFPYDLDPQILSALKFTVPKDAGSPIPKDAHELQFPFTIYDDMVAKGIRVDNWGDVVKETLMDCTSVPASGDYCIRWGNCKQYEALSFLFNSHISLSQVDKEHTYLSFKIRTKSAAFFDVRFMNPETSTTEPWRLSYTLSSNDYASDGAWHTVVIPLSSFKETGAWSSNKNKWLPAEDKFDWNEIGILQFCTEKTAVRGDVFIDDIQLINIPTKTR